jgi:hypothetical protein
MKSKLERIKEILREMGKNQINLQCEAAIELYARKLNEINGPTYPEIKPTNYPTEY